MLWYSRKLIEQAIMDLQTVTYTDEEGYEAMKQRVEIQIKHQAKIRWTYF